MTSFCEGYYAIFASLCKGVPSISCLLEPLVLHSHLSPFIAQPTYGGFSVLHVYLFILYFLCHGLSGRFLYEVSSSQKLELHMWLFSYCICINRWDLQGMLPGKRKSYDPVCSECQITALWWLRESTFSNEKKFLLCFPHLHYSFRCPITNFWKSPTLPNSLFLELLPLPIVTWFAVILSPPFVHILPSDLLATPAILPQSASNFIPFVLDWGRLRVTFLFPATTYQIKSQDGRD